MVYIKAFLVLLFLIYSAYFAGRTLLKKNRDPLYSIGLGLGVFAHLFFLLGIFGCFKPIALASIVIVSSVLTIPSQLDFWRNSLKNIKFDWQLAFVLCLLVIVPILLALCPPYAKDALVYHMFLPKQFLKWGRIAPVDGNIYSNFPLCIEMLFALGVGLKLEPMCGLLSAAFYLLLLIQIYKLLRELGRNWAILGVFSLGMVPSLMITAGWQYVDVATAFFCSLWLGAVKDYIEDSKNIWLIGAFAGLAFSTKYIGGIFLIFALLAWAICSKTWDLKDLLSFGFRVGLGFFIFAIPWLVKNLYYTNNPIYPFLYSIFDGKGWDSERALAYSIHLHSFGVGRKLIDYLLLPFNLVFKSAFETVRFDGKIGYVFLISFVTFLINFFMLTLRFNKSSQSIEKFEFFCVITFMLYFIFWSLTSQQIRFLLSIMPVLWFAWITPIARIKRYLVRALTLSLALFLSLASFVDTSRYLNDVKPWRYLLGRESKEQFLSRQSKVYPCIKFINESLPRDAYVLMVQGGNRGYYMERRFYSDSVFEYVLFKKTVKVSKTPQDLKANLKKLGFTHLLVSEKYLYRAFEPTEQGSVKLIEEFFKTQANLLFSYLTFSVYELAP